MQKRTAFFLLTGLILSGCGVKQEVVDVKQSQNINDQFASPISTEKFLRIISDERGKLEEKFGDNKDFALWQSNPTYTGAWRDNTSLKAGYIDQGNAIAAQSLSALRLSVESTLGEKVAEIKGFEHGVSIGTAFLAQQVLTAAAIQSVIPKINAVGYNPSISKLTILLDDKAAIPTLLTALKLLNVDPQAVQFEVNRFVPLSDLLSAAAIPDRTGNSPVRAGGFIRTDADSCSIGGFASNSSGKIGFITALHCFSSRTTAVPVKMNGESGIIGYAGIFANGMDAAFVQLNSATPYIKTVINGSPRAYVPGDTAGTLVNGTESDPWKEVSSVSQIVGNVRAHGGMTGLSTIQVSSWAYYTNVVYQGPTGSVTSNSMCTSAPAVNTYKGDSGGAVTDASSSTVGIMQSVSERPDANNKSSYCMAASGDIKRYLGITFL